MPDDNTLTDRSYELVEKIENRSKLLTAIVIACFILVPVGIGVDAHLYQAVSHQKGDWSDINTVIMVVIGVISSLLLIIGVRGYTQMRNLKRKLSQIELLEETIYNEVVSPNLHLIR
jgi:membrane protein YdbS with pleckstrin-like domain